MTAVALDGLQQNAVDAPFEQCLAITGAPGTGKSYALAARADRARGALSSDAIITLDHPRRLTDLALKILTSAGVTATLIDDVAAEAVFSQAAQSLFAMEWDELSDGRLDPEIPGLRSPQRFLESAFRLIRKLRAAAIEPGEFLERCLTGATSFYAKPPNFAHPELIGGTKDAYRDSLDIDAAELTRQYRHELDLAKILARLYMEYIALLDARAELTSRDAIARAVLMLRTQPQLADPLRARIALVCIDEAQDTTLGQLALLELLFGKTLRGITLAGDSGAATNTFRGARPDLVFAKAAVCIELQQNHRCAVAIEIACRRIALGAQRLQASEVPPALVLHRAANDRDEATFIAALVRRQLDAGTQAGDIALLFRSVADVHSYERALLERDVPVYSAGDVNCFTDPRALDALALLWNIWDPFRHDWMLRTLGGHVLALSDSTIGTLCVEPADAQTALFPIDANDVANPRAGRWDPKRDLRLGWNVIRGEQDRCLSEVARSRLTTFRALRSSWVSAMPRDAIAPFIERVWRQGLAAEGPPGSARRRSQEFVLARLLKRLTHYAEAHPGSSLGDVLRYAQIRAESALEICEDEDHAGFVRLLSIDAAQGREFDIAIVPDARAGSFPRWYVPDSFLFSPSLGMIPKENVGEARAARTAKFSYYVYRSKARENYNDEERRAFVYAMRRAKRLLVVTASGRATRGTTAPEFFEELHNARLPGIAHECAGR